MMKVAKFGGSSLATADRVRKVCAIVSGDPERRIVVVSAPGKAEAHEAKVTDLLIDCARMALEGKSFDAGLKEVVSRYARIAEGLGLPGGIVRSAADDLRTRLSSDRTNLAAFMDLVKAGGEDNSARLVAEALCAMGTKASYVHPGKAGLVLSESFGSARVLDESYGRLARLNEIPGVVVFPGFFGVTPSGLVVTFPRGGSDITGAVLAAAVRADVYENFTDVDSVMTVNPKIVPGAKAIPELTYREMRELSYAGFGVFHDEAIEPAVRAGIPIHIRNTQNPRGPGTRVLPERSYRPGTAVGIASSGGFCTIYVSKYLMNRELGFGRRLLEILEDHGLSYEHTPSGIDNMSVVLREDVFGPDIERDVTRRIRDEMQAEVSVEHGLALIMIVGEGMRFAIGMAARATGALAAASVNIEMMNQGSSEISMMFGVKADDEAPAVRSLYGAFFNR